MVEARDQARDQAGRVRLLVGLLALLVLALSLTSAGGATASTSAAWTMKSPFSREVVRRGDADVDPYHIAHVRELQYRLKWRGLFAATPNGQFGPVTEAAVKAFQKRNHLAPTGVVGYRTWKPLIKRTVRGQADVPAGCKSAGWHACYDRSRHQVNLYHGGDLLNSWLVRGGGATTQTRKGSFVVYYRDIDHVSALYHAPMPYSQFFSGGQALHGSRLMMDPFVGHSHGCVNFWTEDARQLWNLTSTKKLYVRVYGAWS
ncbi:L,D-transpeptidase family protein [Nocardioides mesophilus]|uniref:Murein L,D-transpeptidase n=1 Tax=Nocardioides mesophilus TaxID=433659 RepID=A0A7G9R9E4_9ACTN|nr:L,D-transpeptidase family protein [Nocardioides mesophilus]QNN52219.1 murein L,D-transpeptidase [Nocardioides mesophilus]